MVGWNSIYRDTDNDYPTARVFRSGINIVDDLKKKRPFFLGVDGFDPHEPLDAPRVFQNKYGGPKGIEIDQGHHAHPAVRDALLVGDRHEARPRHDRAGARAVRGRDRLHGRVDRAADEPAGGPEPARRDGRHLLVRPRADARRAGRSSASTARAPSGTSTTCRSSSGTPRASSRASGTTTTRRTTTSRRRRCRSWASARRA